MRFFSIIFCLFTFLYSENNIHRCGLHLANLSRNNTPPENCSSYYDSENGYFRIHYGVCDSENAVGSSYFAQPVNASLEYVEAVAEAAEYSRNLLLNMGFQQEIGDADGIYDIYLANFPDGYYGVNYASSQGGSFIYIDNDYDNFSCGPCHIAPSSIELMKITVAHEYFHAVQRSYSPGNQNLFFWELSSTWFEDVAYPNINDYLNWSYYTYLEDPEEDFSNYIPAEGYSLALFAHYLTQTYDEVDNQNSDIIRLIWEHFNGHTNEDALLTIEDILSSQYNSSFSKAWSDFNVRNSFNGEFEDMDNNIYYYEDQKYIPPISGFGNTQFFNSSGIVSNIITERGEVEIKPYQLISSEYSFLSLTLSDDEDCGTNAGGMSSFNGFLGIQSNNNRWHRIYDLNTLFDNNEIIALSPGDNLYYSLSSKDTNTNLNYCLNIPYDLNQDNNFSSGDLNLDNVLNILDLVFLIDIILEKVNISEYQYDLVNFNNDVSLNIIDAVTLINIILDS